MHHDNHNTTQKQIKQQITQDDILIPKHIKNQRALNDMLEKAYHQLIALKSLF